MNFETDKKQYEKFEQEAAREFAIAEYLETHAYVNLEANRRILSEYMGNSTDVETAIKLLGSSIAYRSFADVHQEMEQQAAAELEAQRQAVVAENKRRLGLSPLELRKMIKAGAR